MKNKKNKIKLVDIWENHKTKFRKLLQKHVANKKQDTSFLELDYKELTKLDKGISRELLENPEEILHIFKNVAEELGKNYPKKLIIKNLPTQNKVKISHILSNNLYKFVEIEGELINKNPIQHRVVSTRFECPSCGNVIYCLQFNERIKTPKGCGCGRKGNLRLLSREIENFMNITIQSIDDNLPYQLKATISPLTYEILDKLKIGNKLRLTGILEEPNYYENTLIEKKLTINHIGIMNKETKLKKGVLKMDKKTKTKNRTRKNMNE